MEPLVIAGRTFQSRLLLGTGKFSSADIMVRAIQASGAELVTVAMKRVDVQRGAEDLGNILVSLGVQVLPNTSGARDAREAVLVAELGREALQTNWVKLEIHPDARYLLPDPVETLQAAEQLVRRGFIVLPYVHADPVLCKKLEDVGTAAVMPLGAPIGSNQGLQTRSMLEIIIQESRVPVIIDAGLGAPSHAAAAMEMGADAVLVNTAIAVAGDPVAMATAFREAVCAGRKAFEAGLPERSALAVPTSPLTSFLEN
ncbi:MAG: thiazole synthase [Chitinophagales bacterium]|nr:thiazole synthase [Chitinophagales bacterium]MDW8428380.1 thiazole synthase [Chitinophagales bacterium]